MADLKVQIDKLTGSENWTKWKHQIGLLLKCHGLEKIIDGQEKRPVLPKDATADQKKAVMDFEKNDAHAQLLITNSLTNEVYNMLGVVQSSNDAWQRLLSIYEQSSGHRLDRLAEKFFAAKKDPSVGIMEHISAMQRDFHDLSDEMKRQLNVNLPDQLLMLRITSTLPADYNNFRQVWEATALNDRTIDKLIERLRMAEMHDSVEKSSSTAYVAKNDDKKKWGKSKHNIKCYNCHKFGHYKSNCPMVKAAHLAKNKKKEDSLETREGAAFVCSALKCNLQVIDSHEWIKDSGATSHMTADRTHFLTYEAFPIPIGIEVANNATLQAVGHGIVNVEMKVNGKWTANHLDNVWYVPGIAANLFSEASSLKKGYEWYSDLDGTKCMKNGRVVLTGYLKNDLTILNMRTKSPVSPARVYVATTADTLQLFHERLGHQNKRHVQKVLKMRGINVKANEEFCEGCLYGKQHRQSFGVRRNQATSPGEMISADVCGPMSEKSIGGASYFVCFKDSYTKFRRVFFLEHKSEVVDKLEIFLAEAKLAGHDVKQFLSDGGKEFDNSKVRKVLEEKGIEVRLSMPYTPEQNGSSERENRTLVESARTMLHTKTLPVKLWAEAVNTAAYILNRTGATSVEGKSPYELWYNKGIPEINHLRIFGLECFVHIPKERRKKWDQKSTKGILVGYCGDKDGFRVYVPQTNKLILSRDVQFAPERITQFESSVELGIPTQRYDEVEPRDEEEARKSVEDETAASEDEQKEKDVHNEEDEIEDENKQESRNPDNVRSLRDRSKIKRPAYLKDFAMLVTTGSENPTTFEEAMKTPENKQWKCAMDEEMKSLADNNVWKLVNRPMGKKIISSRWVFRIKRKADGSVEKYKARLVAKGYAQKPGIDYDETFSPVARFDTVRTVLSLAANEGLHLGQFDVKTAFLYGELQEEVYMLQPEGFEDGTDRICRLKRSLYGLKQAPRCWNARFVSFLKKFGLEVSSADPCLFIQKKDNQKMLVTIYVDDGLIVGSHQGQIDQFLRQLKKEFQITVADAPNCFLGIQIQRQMDGSVFLHQKIYTERILQRFNMVEANKVSVPAVREETVNNEDAISVVNVPYREAVGCLMYLMTATRPDIAFAVGKASQKLDNPTQADWTSVKRIFRYLQGTIGYGLLYKAYHQPEVLDVYTDADFARDVKTKRSTSGMVTTYSGGAITWFSQKQRSVVLSTTEAEFIAASEGAKEAMWLTRMLNEISELTNMPTLNIDNASAVKLVKNPEFHKRSKHIEVRHFFVREKYLDGLLNVQHLEGENQIADIMTKVLPRTRFEKLRCMLSLCSIKLV